MNDNGLLRCRVDMILGLSAGFFEQRMIHE